MLIRLPSGSRSQIPVCGASFGGSISGMPARFSAAPHRLEIVAGRRDRHMMQPLPRPLVQQQPAAPAPHLEPQRIAAVRRTSQPEVAIERLALRRARHFQRIMDHPLHRHVTISRPNANRCEVRRIYRTYIARHFNRVPTDLVDPRGHENDPPESPPTGEPFRLAGEGGAGCRAFTAGGPGIRPGPPSGTFFLPPSRFSPPPSPPSSRGGRPPGGGPPSLTPPRPPPVRLSL